MSGGDILQSSQIRAARAMLDWSQELLVEKTGLSIGTIRKLELGHVSPRQKTNQLIRIVFESAGLEFLDHGGIRHKPEGIQIYEGLEGAKRFYDDVYATACRKGGETVIVHPSAKKYYSGMLGDYAAFHVKRMTEIKDSISVKCIITEDQDNLPAKAYCEYRYMPKDQVDLAPSYVFDDKFAMIVLGARPPFKIIVIQSKAVAEALKQQFFSVWKKAKSLNKL